jgi:hypothetical protein
MYQGGRQNGGVTTLLFVSISLTQYTKMLSTVRKLLYAFIDELPASKLTGYLLGVPGLLPFLPRSPWVAVSRRFDGSPSPRIDKTRPSPQRSSPLLALGYSKMSLFNRELDLRDYPLPQHDASRLDETTGTEMREILGAG